MREDFSFLVSDEASFINGQNYVVSGVASMMALREQDQYSSLLRQSAWYILVRPSLSRL